MTRRRKRVSAYSRAGQGAGQGAGQSRRAGQGRAGRRAGRGQGAGQGTGRGIANANASHSRPKIESKMGQNGVKLLRISTPSRTLAGP